MNKPAEEKRLLRKASAAETGSAIITALPCPNCERIFRARIGHIAYMRQISDVMVIIPGKRTNKMCNRTYVEFVF